MASLKNPRTGHISEGDKEMVIITLLLMSVAQQSDPAKLTQKVAELQARLADQMQIYNRFVSQGRTSYARDKAKLVKRLRSELDLAVGELQAQSAMMEQKASAERNEAFEKRVAEQNEAFKKRIDEIRALRLAEEKTLLAKSAKKAQTVVTGTSLANYYGTVAVLTNTSGGITYYSFDADTNAIEVPKPVTEHKMVYLLMVDNATRKVIGAALVATKFDQVVKDTALNVARQKCVMVINDSLGYFSGDDANGIRIEVRAGIAEIFKGMTCITYSDAELVSNAVKKGGQDSGF